MTTIAIGTLASGSLLPELVERQRTLATFGFALLILAVPLLVLAGLDPRLLENGNSPWVKPVKFAVSVGLFSLTAAWFFGYVRPERRDSPLMRRTAAALVVSAGFEMFWIIRQAGYGVDSHFNMGTPLAAVMFGLMGIFALILTGTTLPLAWEIGRRPAAGLPGHYVAAVVVGLVLTFVIGTGTGIAMSLNGAHAVGAEGQGLPLFGWNRLGGDIRISHFMGMHAEQVIPAGAAMIGGLAAPTRQRLLVGGVLVYVLISAALLAQALAGSALLPA